MVYEVAWGIASFFTSLFQCAPVQSYWLIQSPVRDCMDVGALYYSTSILNIFTDCTSQGYQKKAQPSRLTSHRSSSHLSLASEGPRFSQDLGPATYHLDINVLSRSHYLHRWSVSSVVYLNLHCFMGLSL
jgi:hypothetical protein